MYIPVNSIPSLKPRILLVEDSTANVLIATMFLEEFGFDFDIASNGLHAFNMYKTGKYVLALMDIQMPFMDGYEATRLIREYEANNNLMRLPIVALTANAFKEDRDRCIASGMDDFMTKPYDPAELLHKINSHRLVMCDSPSLLIHY